MRDMIHDTDPKERGQNLLVASHMLDSECEMARCSLPQQGNGLSAQVPAIVYPSEEGARYMRWIIGSAFEDGFSQFVQTGETGGLQVAVTLTVQTYLGRNQEAGGHLLLFPAGKAIVAVLGSADPIFRHEVRLGSRPRLRLTLQRYRTAESLVQDLLQDGQRIDMTDYITATLWYYEQHGSPSMDLERRAALVHNSFPTPITPGDPCADFILIGYDERGLSRLGTHTRMFREELAGVEKFGSPYYRLQAAFLATEQEIDRHGEYVRETLEQLPLFHAGVVVAVGESCAAVAEMHRLRREPRR
jgi:hypothetical protein